MDTPFHADTLDRELERDIMLIEEGRDSHIDVNVDAVRSHLQVS